ncbi:MAG: DUF951 domain-containing protein [Clostridia bacterium]|nr:DUF951 domain-containing protein [Clostridia bacterium]
MNADDNVFLGDVVKTRKPHPCGGDTWTVIRTGADIKIRCLTCGRIVMMDRVTFLKRRKVTVSRLEQSEQEQTEGVG